MQCDFKENDTKEDVLNKIYSLKDLNINSQTLIFELSKLSYPELNNVINNVDVISTESKYNRNYLKPLWLSDKNEFICYDHLFTVLIVSFAYNRLKIIVDDIDNGDNSFIKHFNDNELIESELNEFKNMFFTNTVLDCKLLREYLNNNKYEKF